jgi:hypothetical protein
VKTKKLDLRGSSGERGIRDIHDNLPWIVISLREAAMMHRRATIIPAAMFAALGLAGPKSGDLVLLALCASLTLMTVHRVVVEVLVR